MVSGLDRLSSGNFVPHLREGDEDTDHVALLLRELEELFGGDEVAQGVFDFSWGHVDLHESTKAFFGEDTAVETEGGEDGTGGAEEFVAADSEADFLDAGFDDVDESGGTFEGISLEDEGALVGKLETHCDLEELDVLGLVEGADDGASRGTKVGVPIAIPVDRFRGPGEGADVGLETLEGGANTIPGFATTSGDCGERDAFTLPHFVDVDHASGEATRNELVFHAVGDPLGGFAGEEVDTRVGDDVTALVLGADVEEFTVVDIGKEVDHSLWVNANEVLEFVNEHGDWPVFNEGASMIAIGTDCRLGAKEFADCFPGHYRSRHEEIREDFSNEIPGDVLGGGFTITLDTDEGDEEVGVDVEVLEGYPDTAA